MNEYNNPKESKRMRGIQYILVMAVMILLWSCQKEDGQLKDGVYNVASVNFVEGTSHETMKERIESMHSFKVKGDSLVLSRDSIYRYKFEDGYLIVRVKGREMSLECEKHITGDDVSYEILLNDDHVKSVWIKRE